MFVRPIWEAKSDSDYSVFSPVHMHIITKLHFPAGFSFFPAHWQEQEKTIAILLIIICGFSLLDEAIYFITHFPAEYSWTDLLINYQGGLVRRGFLGQIITFFANSPYLPWCVGGLFLSVYILWYICVSKLLLSVLNRTSALLLLGSPAIFAFLCHGGNTFGGLYGRKDIFVMAAFTGIMYIAWFARKRSWSLPITLTLIGAIYILGMLIHELLCFYMALPCLLLFILYQERKQKIILGLYMACLMLLTGLFILFFSGNFEQREAIFHFWKTLYPAFPESWHGNALEYIGEGLGEREPKDYILPYILSYSIRVSMVKALLLACAPFCIASVTHNFHKMFLMVSGKVGTAAFYALSLTTILAVFWLMNDFGRIVSTFSIYIIIYAVMVGKIYMEKYGKTTERHIAWLNLDNNLFFAFALCYLFCWRVKYWIPLSDRTYLDMQLWQQLLLFD